MVLRRLSWNAAPVALCWAWLLHLFAGWALTFVGWCQAGEKAARHWVRLRRRK